MSGRRLAVAFAGVIVVTIAVLGLLVNIFERQQEARVSYFKVVDIPLDEPDPSIWGQNFKGHYEAYMRTERTSELADYSKYGRYGGSEAFSRLERYPEYRRLFAGYPFSVEYNEERGAHEGDRGHDQQRAAGGYQARRLHDLQDQQRAQAHEDHRPPRVL